MSEIKPNTIFKGSALKYKKGNIGTVEGFDEREHGFFINIFDGCFNIKDFEPILITDEILKQNDFEFVTIEREGVHDFNNWIDFPEYIYDELFHCIRIRKQNSHYSICLDEPEIGSISYLINFKYFHELQNIIMIFTAKELKFKTDEKIE